jgi:hypothetical protein
MAGQVLDCEAAERITRLVGERWPGPGFLVLPLARGDADTAPAPGKRDRNPKE